MEKTIWAMGIDITKEYMQISCQERGDMEPVSVSASTDDEKYLIPSLLYFREENDTWYIGEQALFNSRSDKRPCFEFDRDIKNNLEYMSILMGELIDLAKKTQGFEASQMICVTLEDYDLNIIRNIFEAFVSLGYDSDRIRVINHDEAFIYYTINQKKDLWVNDVALFDFDKNHLSYRRMHEIRLNTPSVLSVTREDLSRDIYYHMLDSAHERKRADSILSDYIRQEFKRNIVCTVFLTGEGFYDDWYTESLKEMWGSRRRIFKGYNLFVKGACYAASEKKEGMAEKTHIFRCSGRTKADIGLLINSQGKNMTITLSPAGTNWYEAGAKVECILDNVTEINLVIVSVMDGASQNKTIDLSSFPERPNKTTRVRISLAYKNNDVFEVLVEDMGFGELFKSSGRTVQEIISIDDLFSI